MEKLNVKINKFTIKSSMETYHGGNVFVTNEEFDNILITKEEKEELKMALKTYLEKLYVTNEDDKLIEQFSIIESNGFENYCNMEKINKLCNKCDCNEYELTNHATLNQLKRCTSKQMFVDGYMENFYLDMIASPNNYDDPTKY